MPRTTKAGRLCTWCCRRITRTLRNCCANTAVTNRSDRILFMATYYDIRMPIIRGVELGTIPAPYHESFFRTCRSFRKLFPDGLVLVTSQSPLSYRKAVEKLAHYFRRELGYDFTQYSCLEYLGTGRSFLEEQQTDNTLRAFLWRHTGAEYSSETGWPVIGAVCFRFRNQWTLDWGWIHPYQRRKGHLMHAWPVFMKMFGDFVTMPPHSSAMSSFLKKMEGLDSK
jgi:hypothetical protein